MRSNETTVVLHAGPAVSRKVRATAHVPIDRLDASAVPDLAVARVESVADNPGQYCIIVSPRPDLPVGPFRFDVQVRAVTADAVVHPGASIEVSGEMQSPCRVFPRLILLGEHTILDCAEADMTVWLPANGWGIDRIETDSPDTSVSRAGVGPDGGMGLRVTQRIARAGDQVAAIRIVVHTPDGQTEVLPVEVRYHGQTGPR
jgi:hypothetical protein